MGAYIYASGSYHPLEGNQIVSGGQMLTLKENDEIIVNGSSVPVGNPASGADVVIGEMISGATSYTGKILKDCYVMPGGNLYLTSGGIKNLYLTSGGTANLNAVTDITRGTQLTIAGYGYCVVNSGTIVTSAAVGIAFEKTEVSINNSLPFIEKRGSMTIGSGGSANSLTVSGGQVVVNPGGCAYNVSVLAQDTPSGTYGYICSIQEYNLPVSNRNWINNGSTELHRGFFIVNGGTASNIEMVYGDAIVTGQVNSMKIGANCRVYVSSGGIVSGVTVSKHGFLMISSGGVALDVTSMTSATIGNSGGIITYANN